MRIEARGIAVSLNGTAILRGIDLTLEPGQMVGLIGPNGAGKTTLLRVLANLRPPDHGSLLYDGATVSQMGRRAFARQLAYLAQGSVVHWPLTVERLVGLGRLPYRQPWSKGAEDDERAITEALRATETEPLRHRMLATLSSGERTRVLLARALAVEAPALLADEPIAALDPYHQLHVIELLQETARQGKTVVVVLHDLTLAARFCARLVLLDAGRVVADGSPEAVLCAANLARVYRVAVLHGTHDHKPYVLPWTRQPDAAASATVSPPPPPHRR
jgi:iron complex transport system ATP-binding protein